MTRIAVSAAGAVAVGAIAVTGIGSIAAGVGILTGADLLGRLLRDDKVGAQRDDVLRNSRRASYPAEHILGRKQTGGLVVAELVTRYKIEGQGLLSDVETRLRRDDPDFGSPDIADLNLAIVLSEGPCDAIERVWIDGTELHEDVAGSGTWLNGPSVYVHPYLKADGTEGAEMRARTGWRGSDRLDGMSWVYVRLRAFGFPIAGFGRNDIEFADRRPPTVTFLVRGRRITWPGQAVPSWTENAAAIRHWYMTDVLGVDPLDIDRASFDQAFAICGESVTIQRPPCYPTINPTSPRWSYNEIVTSEDDPERVLEGMDVAWQGHVVEDGGMFHFLPGFDRMALLTMEEEEMLEPGLEASPSSRLTERVNSVTGSLAQSSETFGVGSVDDEWLPAALPPIDDPYQIRRDGRELVGDVGEMPFVTSPAQAVRILTTMLRRSRNSARYSVTVQHGVGYRWVSARVGHPILVNYPPFGMERVRMQIVSKTVNPDWTVSFQLVEMPDDTFSDETQLHPIVPRRLSPPGAPLAIVDPPDLIEYEAGIGMDVEFVAVGGSGGYTWIMDGLPPGARFDDITRGRFTGSATEGSYPITVTVRDSEGRADVKSTVLVLTATGTIVLRGGGVRLPE